MRQLELGSPWSSADWLVGDLGAALVCGVRLRLEMALLQKSGNRRLSSRVQILLLLQSQVVDYIYSTDVNFLILNRPYIQLDSYRLPPR